MKPLIQYGDIAGTADVGHSALVFVHRPARGHSGWVTTTKVEKIIDRRPNGPVFETRNTIYTPAVTDETFPVPTYKAVGLPAAPSKETKV